MRLRRAVRLRLLRDAFPSERPCVRKPIVAADLSISDGASSQRVVSAATLFARCELVVDEYNLGVDERESRHSWGECYGEERGRGLRWRHGSCTIDGQGGDGMRRYSVALAHAQGRGGFTVCGRLR